MDENDRERELRDKRFARQELGDLLRLFSSLGITVAVGIVGFFWLGAWLERKLSVWGFPASGGVRIVTLLGGVALTIYWAYLRIARHLEKYGGGVIVRDDDDDDELLHL